MICKAAAHGKLTMHSKGTFT